MNIDRDRQDLAWPNVAKACCILLVVMMHCGDHIMEMPLAHKDQLVRGWLVVNGFIRPIRMPLFFLVSGILASNSIVNPGEATRAKRLVRPIYLYLTWGVVYQFLIPLQEDPTWFSLSINNSFLLIGMVMVMSWYLAALGLYYVFTRVTMGLPLGLTLALFAALSVLGTVFEPMFPGNQAKIMRCAIFFVAGVRMRRELLAFVASSSVKRALVLGGLYVVGALLCVWINKFLLPVDMVGVALGATLSGLAARNLTAINRPATWLARRTLPIYLIHFLLLPVLAYAVQVWASPLLGSFWFGLAYPVLAVPIIVASCLAAHAVLVALSASWLFDLPWRRNRTAPEPRADAYREPALAA